MGRRWTHLSQRSDAEGRVEAGAAVEEDGGGLLVEALGHQTGAVQRLLDVRQPLRRLQPRQPLVHRRRRRRRRVTDRLMAPEGKGILLDRPSRRSDGEGTHQTGVDQFGQRLEQRVRSLDGLVDATPLRVVRFRFDAAAAAASAAAAAADAADAAAAHFRLPFSFQKQKQRHQNKKKGLNVDSKTR